MVEPISTESAGSDAQLWSALQRMGLIAHGECPVLVPLAGGVSSRIVRVQTRVGTVCIKQALSRLKVAQEWYAPVERNRAEVAWMRLAAQTAPGCVPEILGEDESSMSFAMAYLDPGLYPVWKTQLSAGIVRAETAHAVAHSMARVHGATAGRADIAAEFDHGDTFHALRLDAYFLAAARRNEDCAEALERIVRMTAEAKIALMHGDVSPKNILVGPAEPILLDAECACYGDPAFDLAFCANHLLLKCVWRPEHVDSYADCYAVLVDTYLDRVTWESAAALDVRASDLLSAMLLARIDGKSPVEYVVDEGQRAMVRSFARESLLGARRTLREIGQEWKREFRH